MAGQIIQRGDNIFLVRVFLGRDEGGNRRYHNKTIHGTKKDAQKYLTAVLRERDLGNFVEPTKATVGEYLSDWMKDIAIPRLRTRTAMEYEGLLKRYVYPTLGQRKLMQLTPQEIQKLYNDMLERGLSARTVRFTHAVLRSALNQAVKWGMIPKNPALLVDLPRQERKEMRVLSKEQVEKFLETAKEDRWYTLFLLAVTTGMRPGEYLALQWKDIDFATGKLSVCRTLVYRGGGWHFTEPKTSRSRRTIKLPPTVTQALKAHKVKQLEERLAAGPEYEDMGLVFATRKGRPLQELDILRQHFRPVLEAAGLPKDIRLYDLRHTCATLLLAGGINPKIVSEMLGHSSVVMTLDTYSHVLPDMQQGAVDRLEAMLFGGTH
ncbi:MAG: site-specific integrase [Firmicutes bacterium]|nr:site-specific integrase [Bacillota bacterium]